MRMRFEPTTKINLRPNPDRCWYGPVSGSNASLSGHPFECNADLNCTFYTIDEILRFLYTYASTP